MTQTQERPNLTEAQARQAIDLIGQHMADAPQGPPKKVRERICANMLRDWQNRAQGARFTVYAVYYGLANYEGRGVVG